MQAGGRAKCAPWGLCCSTWLLGAHGPAGCAQRYGSWQAPQPAGPQPRPALGALGADCAGLVLLLPLSAAPCGAVDKCMVLPAGSSWSRVIRNLLGCQAQSLIYFCQKKKCKLRRNHVFRYISSPKMSR